MPLTRAAILALSLAAVFVISPVVAGDTQAEKGENLWSGGAPPGGDFTLQSATGPVSLKDLRGKVVLLFFGYTSCPDVCPLDLRIMADALQGLNEPELARVQGLFVSVDPERDSLEKLQEYTRFIHPRILGLTGNEAALKQVADRYGVQYYRVELKGSKLAYAVNHSAATYLIDPEGTLRFIFPHKTPAKVLKEAVEYVLAQFLQQPTVLGP